MELYVAYMQGGPSERQWKTWDGKPCDTWNELKNKDQWQSTFDVALSKDGATGRDLFEIYVSLGKTNYAGSPIPPWIDLGDIVREKWDFAAKVVRVLSMCSKSSTQSK